MGVQVTVLTGVGVFVAVSAGVGVSVAVSPGVGVFVAVSAGVGVFVAVSAGVGVEVFASQPIGPYVYTWLLPALSQARTYTVFHCPCSAPLVPQLPPQPSKLMQPPLSPFW